MNQLKLSTSLKTEASNQGRGLLSVKISILLSFFLCLGSMFPFLSPYPINTDTQPIAHFFAVLVVFYIFIQKGLSREEIFLILFSIFTLFYFNPFTGGNVDMGKYLSLTLGILIFVAFRHTSSNLIWSVVKFAIFAYFFASIIISIVPNHALTIQSYFVREINVAEFGHDAFAYRGVPALATEPGLLGGLLIFLMIQVKYFQNKFSIPQNRILLFYFLLFVTILMTRSGTGYLYFFMFFIISWFDYSSNKVRDGSILLVLIVLCGYALGYVAETIGINNRGLEILYGISSGQTFGQDTSVLKRIFDVSIGLISLVQNPFGVGVNNVTGAVNDIAVQFGLLREVDYSREIELVSGFGWMCVSFGIPGFLFIMYIFIFLSKAPFVHKVFAFIFFSISYSPAFPAIWILLAQSVSDKKSKLQ